MLYPLGCYMYIATEQGSLRVFNIEEKRLTSFELRSSVFSIENEPLIDMDFNPVAREKVALAYETKGIFIWDFKNTKVASKIYNDHPVHCCKYSPDGMSIAVGTRDGCVMLWRAEKNPHAYKCFRPDSNASDLSVSAINTIYWLSSCMIVSGGMPFTSINQITILAGQELNDCKQLELPSRVMPLQLLYTPLELAKETFIVLTQDGSLLTFKAPEGILNYINDLYGGTEVLCSQFYTVSNEGEGLANVIQCLANSERTKVLSGGEVSESSSDIYGLLVTGHLGGIVRFWSVSTVRIYNILNLSITSKSQISYFTNTIIDEISDMNPCKISCLEVNSHKLVVGFDMGKIGVWEITSVKLALMCVYEYHNVPVLHAKISNEFIVSGDLDGIITIYNFNNSSAHGVDLKSHCKKSEGKKQIVSVTCIHPILGIFYLCLSNGSLQMLNPGTMQFLKPPKMERTDYKSEVPKKSEVAIVKILHTCVEPGYLVLCYEKAGYLCSINDMGVKGHQNWTSPLVSASVAYIRSEVFIYVLHSDNVISMLSFLSLKRVWKSQMPLPMQ